MNISSSVGFFVGLKHSWQTLSVKYHANMLMVDRCKQADRSSQIQAGIFEQSC